MVYSEMNYIILPVPNIVRGDLLITLHFRLRCCGHRFLLPVIHSSRSMYLPHSSVIFRLRWQGLLRQLGGEWKAQALACFAVLLAPIQIGISSFYSMNVDRICTYSFARLVVTPNYYRTAIILVDSVWRIAWYWGYE